MLIEAIRRFYTNQAVKSRIAEFCGGEWDYPMEWSSRYLVGFGLSLKRSGFSMPVRVVSNTGIESLMSEGLDLFRSILDSKGLLVVLDIEYFSLDGMSSLYRYQEEHIRKVEPTYAALKNLYHHYGLAPVRNMTASGYHFISFLSQDSPDWTPMSAPLYLPGSVKGKYDRVVAEDIKRTQPVTLEEGFAYERIGRLLTYLCHQVMRKLTGHSPLPLTISDTAPGTVKHPRNGISLDLTQYADPLYMRPIRIPFTSHQKHLVNTHTVDADIAASLHPGVVLPRKDQDVSTICRMTNDRRQAAEYAATVNASIPVSTGGLVKLLADYEKSLLASFHNTLDRDMEYLEANLAELRPFPLPKELPPCLRLAVSAPNPWLLVPTNLQALCFHLRESGFTTAEIAGRLALTYASDYGWQINWNKYDPWTKGLFWARTYCGMMEDGLLGPQHFSCEAHRLRGFCPEPGCGRKI